MAVVLDAAGTEQKTSTGGVLLLNYTGLTVGSALTNSALVAMLSFDTKTVSALTVKWGSQTMSAIPSATATASGTFGFIIFYGLIAPTSGLQTLAITWTGGAQCVCEAVSWTGVNQTGGATSFPHGNSAIATSTAPAVTITSTTGNAVMAAFVDQTQAFTSTNNTNLYLETTTANINAAGLRAAGAASVSCTSNTITSESWAAAGTDIAAAASIALPFSQQTIITRDLRAVAY
jgi:hypothetical protein